MEEKRQGEKLTFLKKHRLDLYLIGGFLLISLLAVTILLLSRSEGAYAVVEIDGEEAARYSLDTEGEYTLNGGTNILVIEDGAAYLIYADCPDHTCVKTGKIRYRGESIVCLPNRVAIVIFSERDSDGVDFVS